MAPAAKNPNSAAAPAGGRQERRRMLTRARLLDSARTLIAERGVDAVGVSEITAAADLGAGTFYNYFQSRGDIVEALIDESIDSFGDQLDRMTADMPDAAEVYASSLRQLVIACETDPLWGWFIVRLGVANDKLLAILGPRATRDLRRGIDSGRFAIPDLEVATAITFGSLISTMHLVLSSEQRRGADQRFASAMLCMVGVPAAEAQEVSSRPLPPLPARRKLDDHRQTL